jgi:SAM-dependent methyltransferase
VPPQELWIGFETREQYLSSGELCAHRMMEIVAESDLPLTAGMSILDFGCGAGRMIRHLEHLSSSCDIWGVDISADHIFWCKQYLTPPFHFATTTLIPHLPFADRRFDVIYAGSVFTHIDDHVDAWLLELRRILSTDGRLYVSIHDQHTMEILDTLLRDIPLSQWARSHEIYSRGHENLGMLVLGRSSESQVFYNLDYFCDIARSMFDVVSVTQEAYGFQTAVVLRPQSIGRDAPAQGPHPGQP